MKVKYTADFNAKLEYKNDASFDIGYEQGGGGTAPKYPGPYVVTPERNAQTLITQDMLMTANVVVKPIPSNYGLITYNGSVITVS